MEMTTTMTMVDKDDEEGQQKMTIETTNGDYDVRQ